jgi:hypothetical protein
MVGALKPKLFLVRVKGEGVHLVRAQIHNQARNYAASNCITTRLATHDEIVKYLGEGVKVENVVEDADATEPVTDPLP